MAVLPEYIASIGRELLGTADTRRDVGNFSSEDLAPSRADDGYDKREPISLTAFDR